MRALLLLLALALAGGGVRAREPITVRIGFVGTLSGAQAYIAQDALRAAQMAADEINARQLTLGDTLLQVEILAFDDKGSKAGAVEAARQLAKRPMQAVIGYMELPRIAAAMPLLAAQGSALLVPSNTVPLMEGIGGTTGGTAYRLIASDQQATRLFAQWAARSYPKARLAVVDDGGHASVTVANDFIDGLRLLRAPPQIRESNRVIDIEPAMLAERLLEQRAELVFFGGSDQKGIALLAALVHRAWSGTFLGTELMVAEWKRMSVAGPGDAAVFSVAPWVDQEHHSRSHTEFRARFMGRYYADPTLFAAQTFDAVSLIVDAVQRAGGTEPRRIASELGRTAQFEGVSGRLGFDAIGDLRSPSATLYRFQDGGWQALRVLGLP